jgi:hypothetical protein
MVKFWYRIVRIQIDMEAVDFFMSGLTKLKKDTWKETPTIVNTNTYY